MRLIDADAVIRFIANIQHANEDRLFTYEEVKRIVRDAPTKEAEPVRHGYWVIRGGDMWCSECGYGDVTEFGEPEDYRYCPNCGARMGETGTNSGKGGDEDAVD